MVGVDNFSDYYSPEFKKLRIANLFANLNINVISCDLGDRASVKELFDCHEFDGVFHFAAQAGVRYSVINPVKYINTNILGTINILEFVKIKKPVSTFFASCPQSYNCSLIKG